MSPKTASELYQFLDDELAWRVKELRYLSTSVKKSSGVVKSALTRAGVPLVYAHWEGYVKIASEAMLCFVSNAGMKYRELAPCFAVHGMAKELETVTTSNKGVRRLEAVKFLQLKMDDVASFGWKGRAETKGNLNYERFCGIASLVGIDYTKYSTRDKFIDVVLLKRRNEIAHGAQGSVDPQGFGDVVDGVVILLESFKGDLQNAVTMKSYLAASVS